MEEYEILKKAYQEFRTKVVTEQFNYANSATYNDIDINEECSEMRKKLMDFCATNGKDIHELNQFFLSVDEELLNKNTSAFYGS